MAVTITLDDEDNPGALGSNGGASQQQPEVDHALLGPNGDSHQVS